MQSIRKRVPFTSPSEQDSEDDNRIQDEQGRLWEALGYYSSNAFPEQEEVIGNLRQQVTASNEQALLFSQVAICVSLVM